MRIVSGALGGRIFEAPTSKRIHPMSEKIRGAIFASLGDISGLNVADLYSGSGALGIEAISRGAKSALAVEADLRASKTILSNLKALKIDDRIDVVNARVESWLGREPSRFELVLADPPYDHTPDEELLNLIAEKILGNNSLLVLSWPGKMAIPSIKLMSIVKQKSFNDAQVIYYRKTDS